MSNFLAPATVSAALQRLLQPSVAAAVPGAKVWVDRPDVERTEPGVTIYLYRSSWDPARRNQDLPTRQADGTLARRPQAAIDLHYLLTFHGKDAELEPLRLLGVVTAALHTRPVVTRATVEAVKAAASETPPTHLYLADTDLDEAAEPVRIWPESLDLEE